jgi:arsenite methyltransferase
MATIYHNPLTFIDGLVLPLSIDVGQCICEVVQVSEIREAVRVRYAEAAKQAAAGSCCGDDCDCGFLPEGAVDLALATPLSLGSGRPIGLAELKPGEVVLDLGSGAGVDVLVAAKLVGEQGHAYGVDMTDEMLQLAEGNRERAGITNASFLKGTIEEAPLPDGSVDVVISNCVINLAADKGAVLRDAYRVLRPGGRFAVADMVALEESVGGEADLESWAACMAGAIPVEKYRMLLSEAGFVDVSIDVDDGQGRVTNANVRARKPALQV